LKICELSVSEEQKQLFTIPNVYWIGISRYEEQTELFAIKRDAEYVGLIGGKRLGFSTYSETETEYCRSYTVDYGM